MKLLILVLSYKAFPFDQLMDVQQTTWGVSDNDITVIYYHGGNSNSLSLGLNKDGYFHTLQADCSDAYEMMHWKFKLTLDEIDYHKYDLIFRTNSCSYVVKNRILAVAETLPRTGCYAGWQNIDYISGAGIFLSPDVLDILKAELTDTPHGAEDVLIGQILRNRVNMIDDKSRTDADLTGFHTYDGYHFRAKTSNDQIGRMRDIEALKELHEKLTK